jgi:hypothetical protein
MIANIAVLARYPKFIDIDSASPPVSPRVVARTLIIQKARVTSGTLLNALGFIFGFKEGLSLIGFWQEAGKHDLLLVSISSPIPLFTSCSQFFSSLSRNAFYL